MEWFSENIIIISAVVGVLAGIGPIWLFFKSSFKGVKQTSKSYQVLQYIKNLRKLGVKEERIAKYVKEYERLIFNKVYKTKLSYESQIKLVKFYEKHKKDLEWSTVTCASSYFDFSSKKATIEIPFSAWFAYDYNTLSIVLVVTTLLFLFILFEEYDWQKQIAFFGVFIAGIAAIVFLITSFITPVNMAIKIKKHLSNT